MKRSKKHTLDYQAIALEVIFVCLAIVSLALLAIDIFGNLNTAQRLIIGVIDSSVAAIFLIEFIIRLVRSGQPKAYFRKNWYLLLAAIPIPGGLAQLLRVVRLEGILRLARVSDHFVYEKSQIK